MVLIKIDYKIYNIEFYIIINIFKYDYYYLKNYKNEILIVINYNNLY